MSIAAQTTSDNSPRSLLCLIEGDCVVPVSLAANQPIAILKEAIHAKGKNTVYAKDLVLLRVDRYVSVREHTDHSFKQLKVAENEGTVIDRPLQLLSYYWPTQPADDRLHIFVKRPLHIVVQSQHPSSLKRSSEVHLADQGSKKRLKVFPEEMLQTMKNIYEQILKVPRTPTEYSDPNIRVSLPFPSVNDIPPRFSLQHNSNLFSYMGREGFKKVLDKLIVEGNSLQRQAVYIYGSKGCGKSYILAALACHLVCTGKQVVYIPDCHPCLLDPLKYLLKAIAFAFVKSAPIFLQEILECENIESLANFCAYRMSGRVYFIVDQLNALDPEPMAQDVVPNADKDSLRQLLNRMSASHVLITSASANHKTFQYMAERDTGEQKVPLMGGMTSSEMPCWWKHHNFVAFSDTDKQRVEDLTGSIPLLLKPFVMHRNQTLASLEPRIWSDEALESVRRQTISFATVKKLELQHPPAFRDNFVNVMRNCLLGVQIPVPGLYMDHRYFYVNSDGNGSYSCGLARQALTEFLRTNAEESIFLGPEWYNTLIAFSHNPSVIGFTVEQMVISKLASSGLRLDDLDLPRAPIHPFDNPTARLSIDKEATYYVPIRFNFKAIDLLFASIDAKKKSAHIVPMQITVAKNHKDSEGAFFTDLATWLLGLEDFDVEISFVWIHHGKRERMEVEKKLRELRSISKLVNPPYTVYWVDIGHIDVELGKTLTKIGMK